jgi:pimeloyl-ACP methyl ester carboxylesterase
MERGIRGPQPIVFISRNRIKEGRADEFRRHYQESVPSIMAGKANTLAQLAYENQETDEATIVRFFADADALDLQIEGAETRSRRTYEFIEPIGIEIFGTLLLLGGDGPAFARPAVEMAHAALPTSQVVVLPGQQHLAMDTAPELLVREVKRFLLSNR